MTKTTKPKRPYDKQGAREIWRINKKRKLAGLPPIKRKYKKTNRKYTYSGRYVGANGGKRRNFRDRVVQEMMQNSSSRYLDEDGNSIKPSKEYQGKYFEWAETRKKNHVVKEKTTVAV